MNDSRQYLVYGLRLLSDHPLPLPPAADGCPDITLTDGGFIPPDMTPHPRRNPDTQWSRSESGARLRYCNARGELLEYRFSACGGRVKMLRTRTDVDATPITLGAAMGAALFLRGTAVLHATALIIENRAVLMAGNTGAGKSTLSAAMIVRGASLLTDDLAAMACDDNEILVHPGFSRMKLYKESSVVAGMTGDHWPRVFDYELSDDKRWLDVNDLPGGFRAEPCPLGAVYLIEGRSTSLAVPSIELLHPMEASVALTRHFYGVRYMDIPLETRLPWAARIAERIPVRRVVMPEDLGMVSTAARMILGEMTR